MISIIIPYYKIIFFKETLLSLANQTDQRFHVYIFDDNSLDDPSEILKEFEKKFSFSYYKFENNLGGISLVKHWKRCIDLVKTDEWLMILGDDDILSANVIRDFHEKLDQVNVLDIDVIRFATEMINERGIAISQKYNYPEVESSVDSLMNKLMQLTRSSLSEHVFRKSKFYHYSFKDYPSALFADDILILEHSSFKNIFTINSSVIQIRKSSVNLSGGLKISNRHEAILGFYKTLLFDFNKMLDSKQIKYIQYKAEREIFNHKKWSIFVFMAKYYFKNLKFWELTRLILQIFVKTPKLIYLKLVKSNNTAVSSE